MNSTSAPDTPHMRLAMGIAITYSLLHDALCLAFALALKAPSTPPRCPSPFQPTHLQTQHIYPHSPLSKLLCMHILKAL